MRAVLLAALLVPLGARAAHPLVSEDAATLGEGGRRQVELTVEGGPVRELGATLTLGLRADADLAIGLPASWSRAPPGGGLGLGDLAFALKWRFAERGGVSLALRPGVSLGRAARRVAGSALLVASRSAGRLALDLNAGRAQDAWHVSVAARAQLLPLLQVVADLGAEPTGAAAWPAFAVAGIVLSPSPRLDLDVGAKARLAAGGTELVGLAGIAWRL